MHCQANINFQLGVGRNPTLEVPSQNPQLPFELHCDNPPDFRTLYPSCQPHTRPSFTRKTYNFGPPFALLADFISIYIDLLIYHKYFWLEFCQLPTALLPRFLLKRCGSWLSGCWRLKRDFMYWHLLGVQNRALSFVLLRKGCSERLSWSIW